MSHNLIDGIFNEMTRCRELLIHYEAIPQGVFGAAMIRQSLTAAEKAISSGDATEMLRVYADLKEIE